MVEDPLRDSPSLKGPYKVSVLRHVIERPRKKSRDPAQGLESERRRKGARKSNTEDFNSNVYIGKSESFDEGNQHLKFLRRSFFSTSSLLLSSDK